MQTSGSDPMLMLAAAIIKRATRDAQSRNTERARAAREWLVSSPWCKLILDTMGAVSHDRVIRWVEDLPRIGG
jgi:hypothetical protein